jgi:hypothetical protein
MWQFARLAVRPNDSDPWTVNIAIPDMQLFSLPQTTENKAEMGPITSLDGFESMVRLLNTFALRLSTIPISVSISVSRRVVRSVRVCWIYGI